MKIKWYKDKQLMNINQKNKVTWLTYPAFEKFPGIVHGFSTRLGGVSQGIYESMNLSFTRGDEESAVRENYRRLSAAMGPLIRHTPPMYVWSRKKTEEMGLQNQDLIQMWME